MRPFLATLVIFSTLLLAECSTGGQINQASSQTAQVAALPVEASPVEASPPVELADLPQSPKAYRSTFTIAEIAPSPAGATSKTDAVIEATDNQNVYKFTGKTDYSVPMSQSQMMAATSSGGATVSMVSNNWSVGARHTIKGKITIKGYTLISDPNDVLVFVMTGKGYTYQKGRGIVILPTNERVFLGRPPSKSGR